MTTTVAEEDNNLQITDLEAQQTPLGVSNQCLGSCIATCTTVKLPWNLSLDAVLYFASPGRLKSLCQDASIMMNNDKALSAAAVSKQFFGKVSAVSKIPTNLLLSEDGGVIPRPPRVIMDRLMRDARQHSIAGSRRCNQSSFEY